MAISMQAQDFKSIINSILKGDVKTLVFDELVDYCFENDQDLLTPSELSKSLNKTLELLQPKSSEVIHIADSKGNAAKYAVAQVVSSAGTKYRMFVYTEEGKIVEIRFNKE